VDSKFVKYTRIYSLHLSKTIRAPLRFVYDWCTDYQETDPLLTGSGSKRKILLRTRHRVVYTEHYLSGGKPTIAVDVVTLFPFEGWHLDYVSDEDDEAGDYVLTSVGPETRIDFTFTEHFKTDHPPSKAAYTSQVSHTWDKYADALLKDYNRSKS
jgi:hypothetical protein